MKSKMVMKRNLDWQSLVKYLKISRNKNQHDTFSSLPKAQSINKSLSALGKEGKVSCWFLLRELFEYLTNDCQSKFLFIIIFDFINSFIILNFQVSTYPPFVHQSNLYCDISFIFFNHSINFNSNFNFILRFLLNFNLQLMLLFSFLRIIFYQAMS